MFQNVYSGKRTSALLILSLLTLFFAFGAILFGYIFVPFAAGAYASLLLFESRGMKIFTFILPTVTFLANLFLNGFYSLEGISYAVIGAVVFLLYKNGRTKSESAFWITLATLLLFALSVVFIAFEKTSEFSLGALKEFYVNLYYTAKNKFVDVLTSYSVKNEFGVLTYITNRAVAEQLFIDMVKTIVPTLAVFSFVISGAALKTFSAITSKNPEDSAKIKDWRFIPTSFIAYFFLIISILSFFATSGIIAESIAWIHLILFAVFVYMGLRALLQLAKGGRGNLFPIILIIGAVMILGAIAFQIISFIGVFYTVYLNKKNSSDNFNVE